MEHSSDRTIYRQTKPLSLLAATFLLMLSAIPGRAEPDRIPKPHATVGPEAAGALVANLIHALHQANVTGNYSVLRDLAAPQLYRTMTTSDLSDHFRSIRKLRLDLSTISGRSPEFSTPPTIVGGKLLWMEGRYPTQPKPLRFKVVLQRAKADWRFLSVDVAFAEPEPTVENKQGELRPGTDDTSVRRPDAEAGAKLRGSVSIP